MATNPATGTTDGSSSSSALRAIVWAGLVAGAMDITAAFVTWKVLADVAPARILKGIASGLLGPSAYQGGAGIAALGLFLHFVIAFGAATVFYIASRKMCFLTAKPFVSGPLYGIAVYAFMYWIVLPLSAVHRAPFSARLALLAIVTHIVCVGTPIALAVRRFSR